MTNPNEQSSSKHSEWKAELAESESPKSELSKEVIDRITAQIKQEYQINSNLDVHARAKSLIFENTDLSKFSDTDDFYKMQSNYANQIQKTLRRES